MAGVAVFVVDLLSKWLVGAVSPGAAITAVPASFVNGSLTVALELAGIALTLLLAATGGRARVGYGLIVGGLLASLWEQVTRGSLTNFIHLGGLPVFNLAHVALLAGIVMVAASLLRAEKSLAASR
jgi:lipoprotein signal peptidase